MSYQQTELHKLHLRLKALETKPIDPSLEPNPDVPQNSELMPGTTIQYQEKTAAQAALDTKDYGAPPRVVPPQPAAKPLSEQKIGSPKQTAAPLVGAKTGV